MHTLGQYNDISNNERDKKDIIVQLIFRITLDFNKIKKSIINVEEYQLTL